MRVLITGCRGQVGHSLTDKLSKQDNVEVLALGREDLDITVKRAVIQTVQKFKPNIIIKYIIILCDSAVKSVFFSIIQP